MGRTSGLCSSESKSVESRVIDSRKVRKPLMEKKRRARINQSLNDLKRFLMETDSVKKEISRPAKLEKADVLELTVTYVQKLHMERDNLRDDYCTKMSIPRLLSPGGSAKFKAGFSECARLVREILCGQESRKMGEDDHRRIFQQLEEYLRNFDTASTINRSHSPSLQSDSCSSFEEKEIATSSPRSLSHRASISISLASEEIENQYSYPTHSSFNQNSINGFELTSPMASPINKETTTSRSNCGLKAGPFYTSPNVTICNCYTESKSRMENHQIGTSMRFENNFETWFTSGSTSESFSGPFTSSPVDNSPTIISNSPYEHTPLTTCVSHVEKSKVWRPW